jgi:adenosylmethionine-8-amino-7-oxononanoate aminotransferase
MHDAAELDHRYVWHPFTQMRDWLQREPTVIVEGKGAVLRDTRGREYLDANSSMWTNLHGHNSQRINAAIRRQLNKIAHSSALGLGNEPASYLAELLVQIANGPGNKPNAVTRSRSRRSSPDLPRLEKVFFSDDGSTAMEVALKLAFEYSRRSKGLKKPKFLSLKGAYHGDTVGAVALGHIDLFHKAYQPLLFKTDSVAAPYCYRCPWNRAKPQRADAREYRRCNLECLDQIEKRFEGQRRRGNSYAAFAFEPLVQGAAGIIAQPPGWLRRVAEIARGHGTLLIADEVLTGLGRAGATPAKVKSRAINDMPLVACHQEEVRPDFVALAKGLSGGYLPMAATLTTQRVFDAFLGDYSEFKTFFHGHSYTGNQLGSAAALASLEIVRSRASFDARQELQRTLQKELQRLWVHPNVGDIRQVGLIAGIELVKNWQTREPFDLREKIGIRICEAMARNGVLTRPIGNVIVLIPPYCTTERQAKMMIEGLNLAISDVFRRR